MKTFLRDNPKCECNYCDVKTGNNIPIGSILTTNQKATNKSQLEQKLLLDGNNKLCEPNVHQISREEY